MLHYPSAPLGFDFAISCLAVSPSVVFDRCEGRGRSAVLLARDGELPAGAISVPLFVTNAARTPSASAEGGVGNTWVLESFVDLQNTSAVLAAPADLARQRSQVPGYEIRDLLEATIGGNTQRAVVTTIFVWFVASQFLDIGSAVELHAPPGYELRCNPRVQYISLPAGSCTLISGVTSTTGDVFHQYLSLALTLPGQQVYPNTAYEFGVAAVNPSTAATPNFWGLVLRKPGGEVADSIRTLPGYDLTDFQLDVQTPLPSSTRPAVVSFVRVALTFARELAPGRVAHISIVAPASTKVLCQRLRDLSGGGNSAEALPLDSSIGTYGTHTCQLQNSVTMHLLLSRPILAASYLIELGVLNPGIGAAKDFWTLELIEEVMEWRTAPAVLQIQVPGFGVFNPFAGVDIAAIANQAAVKAATLEECLEAMAIQASRRQRAGGSWAAESCFCPILPGHTAPGEVPRGREAATAGQRSTERCRSRACRVPVQASHGDDVPSSPSAVSCTCNLERRSRRRCGGALSRPCRGLVLWKKLQLLDRLCLRGSCESMRSLAQGEAEREPAVQFDAI
eukprot:s5155_g2.t2